VKQKAQTCMEDFCTNVLHC